MPEAPAAPASSNDVGSDLSAAWDAAEAASGTSDTASPEAKSSPSASPSDAQAAAAATSAKASPSPETQGGDAAQRARAPDGKFAKAAPATPADAQAAKGAAPEFKIPEKWPADVKARLEEIHKVNPEHAQFVLEQYAHFRGEATRHVQGQAKKIERLMQVQSAVDDLLANGREKRALAGIDDATYIRNLIAAGEVLDRNPIEGLKWLAQRYGVDLAKVATGQSAEAEVPAYVRALAEKQTRIEQFLQSQTQGAQAAQLNAAASWIEQFASQKDAEGNTLYPHFDEVLPEIIVNVQYQRDSGAPIDVKAAYDRAIRMNDSVWLKEQARRNEASQKEAQAKRAREIEDAKRAGFSVSGSGGASSDQPAESLRAELERQWDRTHS